MARHSRPVLVSGSGATSAQADPESGHRFEQGELLGVGGMGEVRCWRDTQLHRDVARKTPRAGAPASEARILREAWITAQLEHPSIAPVYDAGHTEQGEVFYDMRVVRGRRLDELHEASLPELLRHFLGATEAVAYAHAHGVVHRDLKPDNLLVGPFGETLVLDWGLARLLRDDPEGPTAGSGTPGFIAPEQANGAPPHPAADVWSLGAVLAELLGGRVEHGRVSLPKDAPRALAAIAERALRADPSHRYPDARALAEDVARWLDGRPVEAHHYRPWELARLLMRAWRAPLTVAAAAAVLITGAVAVGVERTQAEQHRALQAEHDAIVARDRADEWLARALTGRAQDAWRSGDRATSEVLAAHSLALRESPEARGVLAAWSAAPAPERVGVSEIPACAEAAGQPLCMDGTSTRRILDLGRAGWLTLNHIGVPLRAYGPHARDSFAPLGITLAAGGEHRAEVLSLYGREYSRARLEDGTVLDTASCDSGIPVAAQTTADTSWLMCSDGSLVVWPREQPTRVVATLPASATTSLEIRPDLHLAFAGSTTGTLYVVSLATGDVRELPVAEGSLTALASSPDGRRIAVATVHHEVVVVELSRATVSVQLPRRRTQHLLWPEAERLVVIGDQVETWQIPPGDPFLVAHVDEGITAVVRSADGRMLAAGTGSGDVWLWNPSGALTTRRVSVGVTVKDLSLSPDGSLLATCGQGTDGVQRIRVATAELLPRIDTPTCRRIAWLGSELAFATYSWGLQRWHGGSTEVLDPRRWQDLKSDGHRATGIDDAGDVWQWSEGMTPQRAGASAASVAAPLGKAGLLFSAGQELELRTTGGATCHLHTGSPVVQLVGTTSGHRAAAGLLDGGVLIIEPESCVVRAVLRGHRERVSALSFSGDDRLVTGSWDRTLRQWDLTNLSTDARALVDRVEQRWEINLTDVLGPPTPAGRPGPSR